MAKKSKPIDIDKIAKGLGAERQGKILAGAGYFGSLQNLEDVRELRKKSRTRRKKKK